MQLLTILISCILNLVYVCMNLSVFQLYGTILKALKGSMESTRACAWLFVVAPWNYLLEGILGRQEEMEVAKYLLKNSKVLKKHTIYPWWDIPRPINGMNKTRYG